MRGVSFASPHANHKMHCAGNNALLALLLRNYAMVVGVVGAVAQFERLAAKTRLKVNALRRIAKV